MNHILKHEGSALGRLLKQVEELRDLNTLFADHIGADLAQHCQIVRYENNRLIIITESGSWTTALQFQIPGLLAQLRCKPALENLQAICCKTRPVYDPLRTRALSKKRAVKLLSKEASSSMLKAAEQITDSGLQAVMRKIAKRTNPPTTKAEHTK